MNALALALSVSRSRLEHHSRNKTRYFTVHKSLNAAEDPNSRKIWYAPHPELKALHRQLNKAFLNQVTLPMYIVGGVTGRSYADACRLHANSKSVIRLDIEAFYESVLEQDVHRIWRELFSFAPDVAQWLTEMTIAQGQLPRGAPASTALANLVFFDREPEIVEFLAKHNLRYSRYIDDIAISCVDRIKVADVNLAIGQVQSMLRASMNLKDTKTSVSHAPNALTVHNVNVNREPTVPKRERREIRARVHRIKQNIRAHGIDDALSDQLERLRGTLAWLKQFHPEVATEYLESLKEVA